MKKLKIAIVYDAIYPFVKGGTEKRNYEIAKRLVKEDLQITIYGMQWWEGEKIRIQDGVRLYGICKPYPLYTSLGKRSIFQAVYFALACLTLLKEDFDVLDVNHMPFFSVFSVKLITLVKGKKLYATWNEVWGKAYWREYLGRVGILAFYIEWLSARMPDVIIAVSNHTKKRLQTTLACTKEIVVIPNGVDTKLIAKTKPSSYKSDVIYAGRLLSHKHVDMLIGAIGLIKKSYPHIKCIIVGKGPQELLLKTRAKNLRLNENIIFYDFVEFATDLYSLFKSSKVFVFPTTREGFGISALEANASGIPFITTDHKDNATKELIQEGKNGDTFRLTEIAIAQKIQKYLSVETPGSEYQKFTKNYDWDVSTKQMYQLYTNE